MKASPFHTPPEGLTWAFRRGGGFFFLVLVLAACSTTPLQTTNDYIKQGDRSLEAGDLRTAILSYRMVLHRDSLNAEALAHLARIYTLQGKSIAADRYLRRAYTIPYKEGLSALESGDREKAIAAFEHTLAIFGHHTLALKQLGDLYLARGWQDSARHYYERAVQANPAYAPLFVQLGKLYADQNMKDKARKAFTRAIELDINAADAYMGLGAILMEEGRWRAAVEQFDKVLLIHPASASARAARQKARSHL